MKRHEQWFKDAWTEPRPEPLVMTDTEILDWMNEYSWLLKEEDGVWHLDSGLYRHVIGVSVRDVVCKAAAIYQEANQ